jgi:hypothetical protein
MGKTWASRNAHTIHRLDFEGETLKRLQDKEYGFRRGSLIINMWMIL